MIDEKDRKILNILQQDARVTNADIARRLGMAASATHERIKKLEAQGVIQGYAARVDPKAAGLNLQAFIFIKTAGGVGEWSTGERLAKIPEVQEIHSIAGEDCYLIRVRTRDPESLGRLLREKFGAIDTITATNSAIVLSTMKETTALPLDEL